MRRVWCNYRELELSLGASISGSSPVQLGRRKTSRPKRPRNPLPARQVDYRYAAQEKPAGVNRRANRIANQSQAN